MMKSAVGLLCKNLPCVALPLGGALCIDFSFKVDRSRDLPLGVIVGSQNVTVAPVLEGDSCMEGLVAQLPSIQFDKDA